MSRKMTKSEELKLMKEENLNLRQEISDLRNDLEKEHQEKMEVIRSCLNALSGIESEVATLEGQIWDAQILISNALEQVNLINGKLNKKSHFDYDFVTYNFVCLPHRECQRFYHYLKHHFFF